MARRVAAFDLEALAARLRNTGNGSGAVVPFGGQACGGQALMQALRALRAKGSGSAAEEDAAQVAAAFERLEADDPSGAEAIFRATYEARTAEIDNARKEAAKAARDLATLTALHDVEGALAAYEDAVRLDPDNAEGLHRLGLAQARVGRLDEAEATFRRLLELGQAKSDDAVIGLAAGNLGTVALLRGELDEAEAQIEQSLASEQAGGQAIDSAIDFGNLGLIYRRRGEFELAEVMHKRALAIEERHDNHAGIAEQYGHLGVLYLECGKLCQAEIMLEQALSLNELLGRRAQAAANCGTLGMVYRQHGQPERAMALHRQALAHDEALGRREGVAVDCTNLGILHEELGQQSAACEVWQRAARLYAELGQPGKVLQLQGWMKGAGCTGVDALLRPPQDTAP